MLDIVRESVARSRTGVDEDDIERLQRVVNALQLSLNVPGRHHVAVRKMTKVQFHASLEAPFKRYLIDSDGTLAAVHRCVVMIGSVEVRSAMRSKFNGLVSPTLASRELINRQPRKETQDFRYVAPGILIFDLRAKARLVDRRFIV